MVVCKGDADQDAQINSRLEARHRCLRSMISITAVFGIRRKHPGADRNIDRTGARRTSARCERTCSNAASKSSVEIAHMVELRISLEPWRQVLLIPGALDQFDPRAAAGHETRANPLLAVDERLALGEIAEPRQIHFVSMRSQATPRDMMKTQPIIGIWHPA